MNRIQLWPHQADAPSLSTVQVASDFVRSPGPRRIPHTLFAPLHYESNYAYPLLIWLHGPGDDERQLQQVMPLISMRNYVGAAPRGVCRAGSGLSGFAWRQTAESIAAAEDCVFECLEAASLRFNVAPTRVFVGGYQCGGTMALRVALAHPEQFAGAISVSGPFPSGLAPLAQLGSARRLPLFISQGRESQVYGVEASCEEIRLFHAAGLSVTLRQYPCGDEMTTQMLRDLNAWVMQRVTGVESDAQEDQTVWCEFN